LLSLSRQQFIARRVIVRAREEVRNHRRPRSARVEELAQAGTTRLWVNVEGGNLDRQFHYLRMLGEKSMSRFV
jgi:hypothetical protein